MSSCFVPPRFNSAVPENHRENTKSLIISPEKNCHRPPKLENALPSVLACASQSLASVDIRRPQRQLQLKARS